MDNKMNFLNSMIRRAEYCPDALSKKISMLHRDQPELVQWYFDKFGGMYADSLAKNIITYWQKNF
jgi:hypothetical protein